MFNVLFVIGSIEKAMAQLPHILPDYMLLFAISILTHSPVYKDNRDEESLTLMQQCLWFILEPLITKNDSYNFGFYKEMLERVKNYVDAVEPTNETVNAVIINLIMYIYHSIKKYSGSNTFLIQNL